MSFEIGASYLHLIGCDSRWMILYGGAGSGKSYYAAIHIILKALRSPIPLRILVVRKVAATLKQSVIELLKEVLKEAKVEYKENKNEQWIKFNSFGGHQIQLLFTGVDDPEKLKSYFKLNMIWFEEFTELTKDDMQLVEFRLRPDIGKGQIVATFNPDLSTAGGQCIYDRFFKTITSDTTIHHSTIEDNPKREQLRDYELMLNETHDEALRKIYRMGEWDTPKGKIFDNFFAIDASKFPDDSYFDDIIYGLDFGMVNPTALVKLGIKEKKCYVKLLFYKTRLSNDQILEEIKKTECWEDCRYDKRSTYSNLRELYADSAGVREIEFLKDSYVNVKPAKKGPGSVSAGIRWMQNYTFYYQSDNEVIPKEVATYVWKKNAQGLPVDEPEKCNDHALDAIRYGFSPMRGFNEFIGVSAND